MSTLLAARAFALATLLPIGLSVGLSSALVAQNDDGSYWNERRHWYAADLAIVDELLEARGAECAGAGEVRS